MLGRAARRCWGTRHSRTFSAVPRLIMGDRQCVNVRDTRLAYADIVVRASWYPRGNQRLRFLRLTDVRVA